MIRNPLFVLVAAAAFGLVGCAGDDMHMGHHHGDAPMEAVPASAIDLHNNICPVSGDKITTPQYFVVYEGKAYHFCCDMCPAEFKKDPAKYAKMVAADPAKYGVKTGG